MDLGYNDCMAQQSVFTKIINGDIPCHKVYEDENTFAFMDINPSTDCQVLVVPKEQIDNIEDLPNDLYQAVWATVQKISLALRKVYPDVTKIGLQVEGLEVPHAHVKMFPFDTAEQFRSLPKGGHPDHKKLAKLAKKIIKNIQ